MSVTLQQIIGVLQQNGFDYGTDPHGWRCYNPDRFPGYCTCPRDAAEDILALIRKEDDGSASLYETGDADGNQH